MNLALTMMAHPSRRDYVEQMLLPAIGLEHPVLISWDTEGIGCWQQWKRCAEYAMTAAEIHSHFVILQDDIYPCKDFKASVEAAIQHRPDVPFSLFSSLVTLGNPDKDRAKPYYETYRTALQQGLSWGQHKYTSAQAVVFPVSFWQPFVEWTEQRHDPDNHSYWVGSSRFYSRVLHQEDWRLFKYLKAHRIPLWATIPSLIEHLGTPDTSLMNTLSRQRLIAYQFIGGHRSGLEIDWSKGA